MLVLIVAFVIAGTLMWCSWQLARELRAMRDDAMRERTLQTLALLAPGLQLVREDPRALLIWQPLGRLVRQLLPAECATIDRAAGSTFPFSVDLVKDAHARWTSDWLAWERTHDADYKLKAAAAEEEVVASGGSGVAGARLDAIEREKLDLYQRRYEEYVRVSKALQAFASEPG
jgi:hypothetical protein